VRGEWREGATGDPPHRRVIKSVSGQLIILHDHADERGIEISSNARVLIKSLGTIELDAPNVIIQGRVVSPAPRPI
jgi:hypothetical protein